jgi:hypothetical protein
VEVRQVNDDIDQGEVLWITPDIHHLADLPEGFALRVDEFLGRDYGNPDGRWVWVRGLVLSNAYRTPPAGVLVRVPVDQPRAVLRPNRVEDRTLVEHHGRRYRRVEFPGR